MDTVTPISREQTHICRRCGRKLRSPEAKERGMGPVCYQKWIAEDNHKKLFNVPSLHSSKDSV
jgi:hypothetical protein